MPACAELERTQSPNEMADITSPDSESQIPSIVPNESPITDGLGWSPYVMPTLETVSMKQGNNLPTVTVNDHKNDFTLTPSSDSDDDAETKSGETSSNEKSPFESGWYDRYSYLDSMVAKSAGSLPSTECKIMLRAILIIVSFTQLIQ